MLRPRLSPESGSEAAEESSEPVRGLLGGPWDLVTTYNWDYNLRVISPVISGDKKSHGPPSSV